MVSLSSRLYPAMGIFAARLEDILSITKYWTLFLGIFPIAPNSISVKTHKETFRFVVWKKREWLLAIDALRSANAQPE